MGERHNPYIAPEKEDGKDITLDIRSEKRDSYLIDPQFFRSLGDFLLENRPVDISFVFKDYPDRIKKIVELGFGGEVTFKVLFNRGTEIPKAIPIVGGKNIGKLECTVTLTVHNETLLVTGPTNNKLNQWYKQNLTLQPEISIIQRASSTSKAKH